MDEQPTKEQSPYQGFLAPFADEIVALKRF
jgi:hypothetical protein